MALFKPEEKEYNSFTGICECAVVGFEDKSKELDFADLILQVNLKQKGSDYVRQMSLIGEMEKDGKGNITGGNFAKRLYDLLGVLGCEAGMNIKGQWETEDGQSIDDMGDYLTSRYAQDPEGTDLNYNFLGYFYKGMPGKNGKSYTKVVPFLQPNNNTGKAQLEGNVKWRKDKGFLKEYDDTKPPENGLDLDGLALDNL